MGFYKDEQVENIYWVNTHRLNALMPVVPKSTFTLTLKKAGWTRLKSTKKSPETAQIMRDHGVPLSGWVAYEKPDWYDIKIPRRVWKPAIRKRQVHKNPFLIE